LSLEICADFERSPQKSARTAISNAPTNMFRIVVPRDGEYLRG
jgi:hypothetical protein